MVTCPDCGGTIKNNKCYACGYTVEENFDNRYCAYFSRNYGRCKLLGTVSDSVRSGPGTKFWCTEHFATKGTDEAETVSKKIDQGLIVQENSYNQFIKQKMNDLKSSNPELFYKPNDSDRDDYVQMILAFIKSKGRNKGLPYNKNKKIS